MIYNTPKSHWGTHLWAFIHTITINDFENCEVANMKSKDILIKLKDCFSCNACIEFYTSYLKKLDKLDLTQRMILFSWSVELHNDVNKKLRKSEWTYEMALERWCDKNHM